MEMKKEEFIGKMFELIKDNKYVFTIVCDSFDTCDACPLCNWDDCEALMIDGLCDMIIDLQNKKAETNLEHYRDSLEHYQNSIIVTEYACVAYRNSDYDNVTAWLLAPYEEPKPKFKLSQFEYDLIKAHRNAYGDNTQMTWVYVDELRKLGYLKGVPIDAEVGEILENAEVIEE